jgi:3-hydroxyisobutyrate dehydrogenase-like beta-hydroxyacid dehydrogenase
MLIIFHKKKPQMKHLNLFLNILLLCIGRVYSFLHTVPTTQIRHSLKFSHHFISLQTDFNYQLSMTSSGIGFIGIGIMGEGMAARLLEGNIAGTDDKPLIIWNRTKAKAEEFATKYSAYKVIVKDTAKEVVQDCDVTYSMLSTPEASQQVFYDAEGGVLAGITAGKSIVDCATLAEEDMTKMNEAVLAKGGHFLEAPVSGSKVPAAQGQLIFLCAGSKTLFDSVVDNGLNVMGKASHFFSDTVGFGTRAKLVVNSLMGTMVAAFSEGIALAENVGLDASTMIQVISQGAIASPVYALKGPKMIAHDHAPNFPLKHAHKDMKLASDMAKNAGVEYSVMDTAEALFAKARDDMELNVADLDFSAVFECVHKESTGEYSQKRRKTE